jgi:catechol 2,3-dioxygenase-like lactoylglutathione lyase family enzyme
MEKFAEVSPSRPTARRCSEAKKASGGKACQLRKTLTAEPGSAWRPERRGGARLSRVLRAIWQIPITAAQTAARSYLRPGSVPGSPAAMANELGLRKVAFEVNDLQAAVEWAATEGYGLVGGIGEYEGAWRMAYVRGPEGIIVSLAERIG